MGGRGAGGVVISIFWVGRLQLRLVRLYVSYPRALGWWLGRLSASPSLRAPPLAGGGRELIGCVCWINAGVQAGPALLQSALVFWLLARVGGSQESRGRLRPPTARGTAATVWQHRTAWLQGRGSKEIPRPKCPTLSPPLGTLNAPGFGRPLLFSS